MPEDINELDVTDAGLKGIFGDRFHDETEKAVSKKETTNPKKENKPSEKTKAYENAKWEPVKPDPNFMDKLKACAKWAALFGGLSCLVFYWKESGLMAESIAVPCIAVCTALAGWGCGKTVGGKRQ